MSSLAMPWVMLGHIVSHLTLMTNHRQQYVWSLSWNHSHDKILGGRQIQSLWIWPWSWRWRSWGGMQKWIFLTLQTLLHILSDLHYHQGPFILFLKICMVLDRFWTGLYLLWHESFWGLDHLTELRGGQRGEGSLLSIGKTKTLWELSELNVRSCHWWWMMDDGWWMMD